MRWLPFPLAVISVSDSHSLVDELEAFRGLKDYIGPCFSRKADHGEELDSSQVTQMLQRSNFCFIKGPQK